MSDGDALLSAILSQPDADVPRLIYADWLDEYGGELEQARAEFIRVQVALSQITPLEWVPWNMRLSELRAREAPLFLSHGSAWLAPLQAEGEPLHGGDTHGQFRRGFVEIVWMPVTWFVRRADRLFAGAPVRELRITRTTLDELATLASSPHLSRLNALDLSDRQLGDDAVRVLTRRPGVAALRTLRLRGCGLTDVAAFWLADADFDWPLAELDLKYNAIGETGLRALYDRFGDSVVTAGPSG